MYFQNTPLTLCFRAGPPALSSGLAETKRSVAPQLPATPTYQKALVERGRGRMAGARGEQRSPGVRRSAAAGCGHLAGRAPAPALSMVLSSTSTSAHLIGGFFGEGVKK